VNFDVFPSELRDVPRWVGARLETRDGRTTKVPYCASNPARKASSTDPSTWSDFATARQAIESVRLPLLGFVLGDGFVGVDLDHCITDGKIEPWAQDIVQLLDTYTEISVVRSCASTSVWQPGRERPLEKRVVADRIGVVSFTSRLRSNWRFPGRRKAPSVSRCRRHELAEVPETANPTRRHKFLGAV